MPKYSTPGGFILPSLAMFQCEMGDFFYRPFSLVKVRRANLKVVNLRPSVEGGVHWEEVIFTMVEELMRGDE